MKNILAGALLPAILFSAQTCAEPADYVYVPAVQYGEREIDFKYGTASPVAGSSAQGSSIGYGYGATEYWFTEIYLKQERNGDANVTIAEWENKFQLTETGKYPVDAGFIVELEAPLSGDAPKEIRLGPLLQTEFGRLQLNGNLLFQRAFNKADGTAFSTDIGYQLQAKYRWRPALELGLQAMGEMGKWNNWDSADQQNHRIGPAVFGKLALGNRQVIKYNAAWLLGSNGAAPDHTARIQIEYEF
ncbi:MAG: hypothetical protein HY306_03870 [Nitrosomonadales bacterium]|nr:hypothetical protein [Nitrosomonadales bacterium]